jgi:peroxiredoxin
MTRHANRKKSRHQRKNRSQILAMGLVGLGLLLIGVLALILLPKTPAAGGSPAQSGGQPSSIPVAVNYQAPELSLMDLENQPVSLSKFRGKVVLVNNWATWCPPCKAEMPTLQAYFESHAAEGFTIIAVEAGDPASEVAAFAKQYQLSFNVWPDPETRSIRAFRNEGLPNSFVIDQDGKVRLTWTGAISRDMLEKYVTPLLKE